MAASLGRVLVSFCRKAKKTLQGESGAHHNGEKDNVFGFGVPKKTNSTQI